VSTDCFVSINMGIKLINNMCSRSQWPRNLRLGSVAARLLRLWVRIPLGVWMSLCFECCVLSGRGLCDGLIIRPEESYWLWCVAVCDLETSWMRRPWPTGGCWARCRIMCVKGPVSKRKGTNVTLIKLVPCNMSNHKLLLIE